MRIMMRVLLSAMTSLVGTLALAVFSILSIMFQTTEEEAYRTALFGSVFFRSELLDDGNIEASAGIQSFAPLGVIWAVIFVFCLLVFAIYDRLKARRRELLEQQDDALG
ncbi:hypothetical protein D4740_10930 [Actinomyces sp. 2119]|uniref:hypothetical protein n=1 Tax=Actinomyces sp. 2119 TaxID=2321393 RepID=UPI000E6D19CE|nr:hypothetical protein [Actinomyces sp. 2119]RJF40676.1 hypothetical protein D4740_10930 [Actinomyces sp. 2119]